jgi:hypothetical protein
MPMICIKSRTTKNGVRKDRIKRDNRFAFMCINKNNKKAVKSSDMVWLRITKINQLLENDNTWLFILNMELPI